MGLEERTEDELRRAILANAAVLFPPPASQYFDIVFATYPRLPDKKSKADTPPWQYAILLRKTSTGESEALMKGTAWSTGIPWSHALRGLLDNTATAIHKKFAKTVMPGIAGVEELPEYSPVVGEPSTPLTEKGGVPGDVVRGN